HLTWLYLHILLSCCPTSFLFLSCNTSPTQIYTLSLHDALPISAIQMDQPTLKKSLIGIPYLSFLVLVCLVFLVRQVKRQTRRLFVSLGTASRPCPGNNTKKGNHA